MEIISGLSNAAVIRQKSVWTELSDKHLQIWNRLDDLMSPKNGYKKYQTEISHRNLPVLPYFGVFLHDLTFITQNPTFLEDGSINFELIKKLGSKMDQISKFQSVSPKIKPDGKKPLFDYLNNVEYCENNDELFQLSLQSEPLQSKGHSKSEPCNQEELSYMLSRYDRHSTV